VSPEQEEAFRSAASVRMVPLRRVAFALCGEWHAADDLVQTALVKLYAGWPLRDPGAVDGWLRQTMVRAWIDETRRPWWRRERVTDQLPDGAQAPGAEAGAGAGELVRELDRLPPRQRACLVLRFLDDCSVEQTAQALDCATGTVKSQTSRGLTSLRRRLTPAAPPTVPAKERTRP